MDVNGKKEKAMSDKEKMQVSRIEMDALVNETKMEILKKFDGKMSAHDFCRFCALLGTELICTSGVTVKEEAIPEYVDLLLAGIKEIMINENRVFRAFLAEKKAGNNEGGLQ